MTTAPAPLKFSFNIARDYTPDWGLAEGVREFIANTLDESGTIDTSDPDTLILRTTTSPSLSELTIIGKSTKRDDSSKIGQFGEGAKVGANALLRAGAYLRIDTESGRVTFSHETPPGFDCSILHAHLDRSVCEPGCTVTICFAGVCALVPSIYISAPLGPIPKPGPTAPLRLFVKGIAVKAPTVPSLFDWNTDLAINRDRATVDSWNLKSHIARWFCTPANYSDSFLFACFDKGDTIEAQSLQSYLSYYGSSIKDKIRGGLTARFGSNCVLSSGNASLDAIALARGYTIISLHTDLANQLRQIDETLFATVSDKVRKHDTFLPVPLQTHQPALDELTRLLDLLDVSCTIQVFDPRDDDKLIGYCDHKSETVWLCSTLFRPGARKQRLATFCHELAHLPGHKDLSLEFQHELTRLLGLLASHSLSPKE